MSSYIVTRTVPGLQMMRVDVDRRELWRIEETAHSFVGWAGLYEVETHRPQTLRARLWRWVLGG